MDGFNTIMDFGAEHIPLLSLIVIPAVGWLHRQLSKLTQESIEQEQKIEAGSRRSRREIPGLKISIKLWPEDQSLK